MCATLKCCQKNCKGERVVYDNSNNKVHRLNATMSWLWSHCDGSRTVDELVAAMQADTVANGGRDLIISGLKQLSDADLLEPESLDRNDLWVERSMVSRRAAVAVGASLGIPMMTSILAPMPAAAKSKPDKDKDK